MEELPVLTLEETREARLWLQLSIDGLWARQKTRSLSIAITKLEEAKMWLGKHMWEVWGEDLNAKRDSELNNK